MSPEEEGGSLFDGYGESALLDAKRLVRAGELASRANPGDDDCEAFGAVFRAVAGRLELVEHWIESGRQEVLALRAGVTRKSPGEPASATGS